MHKRNFLKILLSLLTVASLWMALNFAGKSRTRWLEKAQQPNLPAFNQKAYEQLALLRSCRVGRWSNPGGIETLDIHAGSDTPAKTLYQMGLDVLPILVEALDDTTPTGVVEPSRSMNGIDKTYRVNELVASLIMIITQQNFVVGSGSDLRALRELGEHPELVPQFQKMVLNWYRKNRDATPADRQIAAVNDGFVSNRLMAVRRLGQQKNRNAVPAITQTINRTLAIKERSSLVDAEIAQCALALGQIGDKSSLPIVRRVCRRLSENFTQFGVSTSGTLDHLFEANQGRALLGEKQQALQELSKLYKESPDQKRATAASKELRGLLKNGVIVFPNSMSMKAFIRKRDRLNRIASNVMGAYERKEYQEHMKKAAKW